MLSKVNLTHFKTDAEQRYSYPVRRPTYIIILLCCLAFDVLKNYRISTCAKILGIVWTIPIHQASVLAKPQVSVENKH